MNIVLKSVHVYSKMQKRSYVNADSGSPSFDFYLRRQVYDR